MKTGIWKAFEVLCSFELTFRLKTYDLESHLEIGAETLVAN